jgi:peptidoglycan hydrolase-like protein with peptidoglycan-binding domain
MRSRFIAAAVSIVTLAMPATAMAAGGGSSHAESSGSASPGKAASVQTFTVSLALGSGYERRGGSQMVRRLQRRLAAAGFDPGPIDGLYGPRTAAATERFQATTGLAADGVAGPRTLVALNSPTPTLYPGAGYGANGSRSVRALQRLLAGAGYHPGRVDGLYGASTERAVRLFQATHRLPVDGIAHSLVFTELRAQVPPGRSSRPPAAHRTSPPESTHQATVRPATAPTEPAHAPAPPARRTSPNAATPWLVLVAVVVALGVTLLATVVFTRRRSAAAPITPNPDTGDVAEHGADAETAFRLGVLAEEQNDPVGAEDAYRRADAEGHAAAASNLGVLLERRGDRKGAEAAYRRADQRSDANGSFNLAMLLEERSDTTAAEAAYRRADSQGHAAAASNLGVLLERRGDLKGAEAAYRRADQRGDPNGSFNLAVLLEEHDDPVAAEAAYRRADQHGPAEVANAARAALLSLRARLEGANAGNGAV